MVLVVDELKRKQVETGLRVGELRAQIILVEQQQAAFDVVMRSYDPDHAPMEGIRPPSTQAGWCR